jgi:hypothetical protein
MITTTVTSPVTATIPVQVSTYSSSFMQCGFTAQGPYFDQPLGLIFNNDGTVTTTQDPTVSDLYITGPPEYCQGAFATDEGSNFVLNAPGGMTMFPLQSTDFGSITAAQFVAGTTTYTIPTDGPGNSNFKQNTILLIQTRMGVYVKLSLGGTSTSNYGAVQVPAVDVADSSGVFEF